MGTRTVMETAPRLAKAASRALVAAVAVGSLLVLLDASAKYPGFGWRAAGLAPGPSELEREVAPTGFTPLEFRLSANLSLEGAAKPCVAVPGTAPASANGDGSFDNSCSADATVKAVGDLPRAELLFWPGDWLYHRALHF